jgi:methylglutaconyl-CoA hydratase
MMTGTQLTRLKVSEENHVMNVALNRPSMRNAFDAITINELTDVFNNAGKGEYSAVRVVILSGQGASFCSGADLAYMQSMTAFSREENKADAERLFAMFESVRKCVVPVIVHIHGHAMGGAVGIAACADVVLAEAGTQLRFSEVRLGILPAVISSFVLAKMDASWARRWMITGEMFDATQAMQAGLVQFVGTSEEVNLEKARVVTSILEGGPEAVRMTKALLNEIGFSDPSEVRDRVTDAIADRRTSNEGQEGLSAFLNKREPSWRAAKSPTAGPATGPKVGRS